MMRIEPGFIVHGTDRTPGIVLAPPRPTGRPNEARVAIEEELIGAEQRELFNLIQRLVDPGAIENPADFKYLKGSATKGKGKPADARGDAVFELKLKGVRVYGFHHDALSTIRRQRVWCLVTWGGKQSQAARRANKNDYERAARLRDELL